MDFERALATLMALIGHEVTVEIADLASGSSLASIEGELGAPDEIDAPASRCERIVIPVGVAGAVVLERSAFHEATGQDDWLELAIGGALIRLYR